MWLLLLLQGSAKLAKSLVLDKQDFDGSTPLMLAAALPDASVRNALCSLHIEAGADVKLLSRRGASAADVTVTGGDTALGQTLIDRGAPATAATTAAVAAAAADGADGGGEGGSGIAEAKAEEGEGDGDGEENKEESEDALLERKEKERMEALDRMIAKGGPGKGKKGKKGKKKR
jgi:ankyrin repeat protein